MQLRHIASYLIWSFSQNKSDEILHEMILLIGYFTVLNNDNQVRSGRSVAIDYELILLLKRPNCLDQDRARNPADHHSAALQSALQLLLRQAAHLHPLSHLDKLLLLEREEQARAH